MYCMITRRPLSTARCKLLRQHVPFVKLYLEIPCHRIYPWPTSPNFLQYDFRRWPVVGTNDIIRRIYCSISLRRSHRCSHSSSRWSYIPVSSVRLKNPLYDTAHHIVRPPSGRIRFYFMILTSSTSWGHRFPMIGIPFLQSFSSYNRIVYNPCCCLWQKLSVSVSLPSSSVVPFRLLFVPIIMYAS